MAGGHGAEPGALSIGEVLARLRPEFADVTISKIRFLESEGLVEPDRAPSGYRRFTDADVERLRYVLAAQRDHYLPLRVIKEHLAAIDRGLEPPAAAGASPAPPAALVARAEAGLPAAADFEPDPAELRLTREELLSAAGIDPGLLDQLTSYGLLPSDEYDADALLVAKTAGELAAYGVEPRHLRPFRTAAEREVGLIEQITGPRGRDGEVERALAALSIRLHTALVRTTLRHR
jgi:DNA-binding transcriptional MerR regulator